jgi:F-type H+-transporting ATPase subunit b
MPIVTGSNFLVPNGTFIVELVAFIIVLAVIGRYVLPPVNRALKERQTRIAAEIAAADQARQDATRVDEERRVALEDARRRAREILEHANRTADQALAAATAQGQEEHARILAGATAEVNQARQRAVDEATAQVGELIMEVVERIIGREASPEVHRDLIDEAIAAMQVDGGPSGGPGA